MIAAKVVNERESLPKWAQQASVFAPWQRSQQLDLRWHKEQFPFASLCRASDGTWCHQSHEQNLGLLQKSSKRYVQEKSQRKLKDQTGGKGYESELMVVCMKFHAIGNLAQEMSLPSSNCAFNPQNKKIFSTYCKPQAGCDDLLGLHWWLLTKTSLAYSGTLASHNSSKSMKVGWAVRVCVANNQCTMKLTSQTSRQFACPKKLQGRADGTWQTPCWLETTAARKRQ